MGMDFGVVTALKDSRSRPPIPLPKTPGYQEPGKRGNYASFIGGGRALSVDNFGHDLEQYRLVFRSTPRLA
jgi:hypothetical protein